MKNRPRLMILTLVLYAGYAVFLAAVFQPRGWGLLYFFIPLGVYETGLRLWMRKKFGKYYRYAIFNYLMVDHPVYGFAFRKNSESKKIPFPIFDKFAFRAGVEPSVDLKENIAGRVDFDINSLGFRGPEFSLQKKDPNMIRIFASGDSTTACAMVGNDEAWPAVLEKELRGRGVNAEVINAGVGAWSSYQEWLRFEREIINYQPDIVLLNQGWNEEFWFSAQNLGRNWQPKQLLGAVEMKTMYARVGSILSSTASLFLHFLAASYYYDHRFKKNMDFNNPDRWQCLKRTEYLQNWFDNMINFAQRAQSNNIKLYTVNAPGLVSMEDSPAERQLYIKSTKLTEIYADYQAASRQRLRETLLAAHAIIPCIDVETEMSKQRGQSRRDLFIDKIHLNPKGNALLASIVCDALLSDKRFYGKDTNLAFDNTAVKNIRDQIGVNDESLNGFIDSRIKQLKC
ncbi:MAG: hypothetical protein A3C85_02635 [Candidatus Doudnabacteria bacterium RIFCSPHIGHO2_02_FULL_48_21]|uniref:SGNH hydrolase-type esterase domain-containing protein n=1 Tax=Candidatus Doudnabacteria bacterium RIFCSPLOWO2_02_FULL_48_13 TaxID=1817845 RepID=A0A1F5QAV3_9BACT|nr:MAG: hypothetical protein A3K05_03915 [Candidatus Doudnabacteria bacterium RIFCSPHIGHO2_01_48_18]OGE78725.1 MAG: hypothetical protein A2668_04145 [Candidatus Doudnabacteria bacterium RIFCSPHIGHO2_01_FULL_48_180]OGE91405.1 MAG: hypothetical protein A3F44_00605 [Candidatus Doudnabacteria bacterium RIFCSPHIGHO2_12_FULL_47_25]OGE93900.1 MAG: hypothetical protein A3C85_02635 [Candidatus Doudnabacteria bacterium RIFCSPHIGHO2_02_FULL_48_21]OGE97879.1 MAG: hypothetical protein A3A83_02990 [Candidatu